MQSELVSQVALLRIRLCILLIYSKFTLEYLAVLQTHTIPTTPPIPFKGKLQNIKGGIKNIQRLGFANGHPLNY